MKSLSMGPMRWWIGCDGFYRRTGVVNNLCYVASDFVLLESSSKVEPLQGQQCRLEYSWSGTDLPVLENFFKATMKSSPRLIMISPSPYSLCSEAKYLVFMASRIPPHPSGILSCHCCRARLGRSLIQTKSISTVSHLHGDLFSSSNSPCMISCT